MLSLPFAHHLGARLSLATVVAALAALSLRGADQPITVTLDARVARGAVSAEFAGLSYEVTAVLPAANGRHYFAPDNTGLVTLFRSLGIGSLRVGGNTSDRNAARLPSPADLDALFGFARAAGVRVIYCLRLHDGDPAADAATAKYIMNRYAPWVDCFSIGQEPSAYPVGPAERDHVAPHPAGAMKEKYPYSRYHDEWRRFARTIIAAVPGVRFCGPSVHNNAAWTNRFIADFGRGYHVTLVSAHLYAGGAATAVASDQLARDWMLSSHFTSVCERLASAVEPHLEATRLPFRLEETNSYYNGGRLGASDTFASALWGLDYLDWWAAHGAAGLNFHTGDGVSMNGGIHAPAYGVFTSGADGYDIKPLAYALKAFSLAGPGTVLPVAAPGAPAALAAYAVRSGDQLTITLINRSHDADAKEIAVTLEPGDRWHRAKVVTLRDRNGEVAARTGITLGGAPIDPHGGWDGHWSPVPAGPSDHTFSLTVPAASAAIIRLDR
ncbi:MAG TPA: hypothetical protein VHE61_04810 [Opitutaceae bacterium]|nr:hypothetical protein [Opitutaceae bacterium]